MVPIFRGVDISAWSCQTAAQKLIDFIENDYSSRSLMDSIVKKQRQKYTEGSFKPNDAFKSFCIVVSYASNHYAFCYGYPSNWHEKYNTYTRRKVAWSLLNKFMYQIAVKR